MLHRNRWIVAMVGSALLLGSNFALAQDWPQWRGANRDARVSGFAAPESWPKELTHKWKITVGSGAATPALVGDLLYVFARQGDEEVLMCLNAADGKEKWNVRYRAPVVGGPARDHGGPRSCPTVVDGKVATLGVGGTLCCIDATTGKEAWRKDDIKDVPRFYTSLSPLVVDKMCIAHLGGRGSGVVAAYDLATGEEKWKWSGDGPSYASPALLTVDGSRQVVVQTETNLVGLSLADGKLLWKVPTEIQGRYYNAADPVVTEDMVIYTGQGSGVYAVKIEKKDDGFAAREVWHNDTMGTRYNTLVLKDGLLYGISDGGRLFCLNAKDGQTAWADETRRQGGFGTIVDAGPVLMALPSTSELIVLKPDGKAYTELAKYKVSDAQTYSYPIVSGKRVFVKDRDSLILYTIE